MRKLLQISLIGLSLLTLGAGCDDASSRINSAGDEFTSRQSKFPLAEAVVLKLSGAAADSVRLLEGAAAAIYDPQKHALLVDFHRTGTRLLKAEVYRQGKTSVASMRLNIYAPSEPEALRYRIVERLPHNPEAYTQGLEFADGKLYESRGQYGFSRVERFSGDLRQAELSHQLPDDVFGEGLTVLGDEVIQLSWQEGLSFYYDRDLNLLQTRAYPLREGWGICNDGRQLWVSDGSNRLYQFSPAMELKGVQEVYEGPKVLPRLNELEYAGDRLWANVYRSDRIYRIDHHTGVAEAYLDLSALRRELKNPRADVLNGIAWHPGRKQFLVTGKYWDQAFWIEVVADQEILAEY